MGTEGFRRPLQPEPLVVNPFVQVKQGCQPDMSVVRQNYY